MLDALAIRAKYSHRGGSDTRNLHFKEMRADPPNAQRIVLLVRDPRDTSVSHYYQVVRRERRYSGSISEFLRDPCYGIEKCARFNLVWSETARIRSDMMVVSYEAMHDDTVSSMHAILNFLASPRPDQQVREVVVRNRFKAMQAREIAGDIDNRFRKRLGAINPRDPQSLKCRRGRVGGYREELSLEDIAYCDRILKGLEYFDRLASSPHDSAV